MNKKLQLAALALSCTALLAPAQAETTIEIKTDPSGAKIEPAIFGQFAEHLGQCIYGGIWVGEDSSIPNTRGIRNDVIEALKELQVPVIRWPGGCFADEYHWKNGIGPQESRPKMINTNWGGVVEDNSFGTHEFLDLCELVGAEPYICGNVGSGSVQEMAEWVEYMTSNEDSPMANLRRQNGRDQAWKIPYFGVGNESWGCGGSMRPEYYADLYRRFSTFVKNYSGNSVYKIASGSNADDYNWTEVLMERARWQMNGLSLHYYTIPTGDWGKKGSATDFGEDQWFSTLQRTLYMDEVITDHSQIMDEYDPEKRVGLMIDEWGIWTDVEPGTNPGFLYQQNSLRDALVAGININIFIAHADRVKMTNIAQMINVLQTMLLTKDDQMVKTPTFYAFKMLNVHQGATELNIEVDTDDYSFNGESIPAVTAAASRNVQGQINISLCNLNPNEAQDVTISLPQTPAGNIRGTILTSDEITAHNTFENPDKVKPEVFNGASVQGNTVTVKLPAKSLVVLSLP
ncbi:MAG: alpha-N-arabinofuranosidase [Opitutales bacterium]|nr:alpha-N-arabinofuranosidase [Opitutales bacterium]